jgi:subtilase family serine protease
MKTNSLVRAGVSLALGLGAYTAAAAPQLGGAAAAPAVVQAASPTAMVQFSVYLPLRHQDELETLLAELHDKNSSKYQQWLQPSDFMQRFGPSAADLAALKTSMTAHGFTILQSNAHGVIVQGSASAVSSTFSAALHSRTQNGRTRYMAKGNLSLPNELASLNARVIGLDSLPEHHVHSRALGRAAAGDIIDNRYTATGSYWFDDLKQAYDYPAYSAKTDGTGVSVAILMADLIFPDDLPAAFVHEKFTTITGKPAPTVTTVTVDGGGVYNGYGSFEASLDTQQVTGGAPGAAVTLVSIPDLSNQHIADGYTYIVDSNAYDIVNSSFGGCELEYFPADNEGVDMRYVLKQLHEIFAQGNAQGITFVASTGDEGGPACPSSNYGFPEAPGTVNTFGPGISSPSDDPDVTAVGGGNLITASDGTTLNSAYVRESAFADPELPYDIYGVGMGQTVTGGFWGAGGGISSYFQKPLYQFLADTGTFTWRTNPDVGMQVGGLGFSELNGTAPGFCNGNAISCSPDDSSVLTAYGIGLGGGFYFTIGTSVSSPEFVGALAIFEQQFGKHHRQGNVNYFLYAQGALQSLLGGVHAPSALQFYHRNIPGNDGFWNAGFPSFNYDYIYGQGSPDVRKLFGLEKYAPAGLPQTSSNP